MTRGAWYAAALALGVGVAAGLSDWWGYLLVGLVVAGALSWLAGGWALPWGADRYMRRLQRLSASWRDEVGRVRGQSLRRQLERRDSLVKQEPPPEWAAEHETLCALLYRWYEMLRGPLTPSARAEAVRGQVAIAELAERLGQAASNDRQRPYVARLEAVRAAERQDEDRRWKAWHASARDTAERLSRLKPPAAAAAEHERLVNAMRQLVAVGEQLREATLQRNPDAVMAAGESLAQAEADISSINDRLREKLA